MIAEEGRRRGYSEEEIAAAIDNPRDPAYRAVFVRYAAQQGVVGLIRGTLPVNVVNRGAARDALMATYQNRSGGEPIAMMPTPDGVGATTVRRRPGGDPYADGVLTRQELDWLQAYKDETGVWLGPGEYDELIDEAEDTYAVVNAGSPEARQLEADSDAWEELGTARGRFVARQWGQIYGGTFEGRIAIGGNTYTAEDLANLTPAQRAEVADAWVVEHGLADDLEAIRGQQERFEESHPEWAAYRDWQGDVYGYEGGPLAWWEAAASDNPNAQIYLDEWRQQQAASPDEDLTWQLATTSAYLAWNGNRRSAYDPEPESVNDNSRPSNPTPATSNAGGPRDGGGGGGGKNPSTEAATQAGRIAEDLATYQADLAAYDASVMAITGGQPLESLRPAFREWYQGQLRSLGITPPRLPQGAEGYLAWAQQQPAGADTSIQAYVAQAATGEANLMGAALSYLLGDAPPPVDLLQTSGSFNLPNAGPSYYDLFGGSRRLPMPG